MKKLKQKIKRALAGFLKDELLDYIGYNHKIPLMSLNDRFVIDQIPFETLVMELEIPIEADFRNRLNPNDSLEHLIISAKEKFARQVMEHIHVEAQNLTSNDYYMRRSVKFMLRVQKKR